jgi:hypothetical protein
VTDSRVHPCYRNTRISNVGGTQAATPCHAVYRRRAAPVFRRGHTDVSFISSVNGGSTPTWLGSPESPVHRGARLSMERRILAADVPLR